MRRFTARLGRIASAVRDRIGQPVWRWPRRAALSIVALMVVGVASWWIAVLGGSFPDGALERGRASLEVTDAAGETLRHEASGNGSRSSWVPLASISTHLVAATLASEDNAFYEHAGVDWSALARASWLNLRQRDVAFGGSTITMQLVRLTAKTRRTLWGKARQAVLAARLERELDKDQILEHYLNRVYYGNSAWGAERAAWTYFGKSAADLSLGEAATLAVLPRGPTFYDPFSHWGRLIRRRDHILGLMQKHGHVTASERQLAQRTPIDIRRRRASFRAPHFVQLVKRQLPPGFATARVTTTLDPALQRDLEVALERHLARLASRHVTQAALVVLRNSDGAVLALVGSRDYSDAANRGAWSGATARLRPGSTLKPFVYGAAMEQGDTPATVALDVPLRRDVGQFYTKDVKSHGFARYRESLAGSYNLSAVHTLQRVGVRKVLTLLRRAGLSTLDAPDGDYDWGLAIGHAEVRLIDLTAAFSTFGRGGRAVVPRTIISAAARDGRVWSPPAAETERVFSEAVSYLIFDILSDPDARKPMFGDRVPMNLTFPVALKTGTTKAYTDLWALGTTREYTVGVWAGNFDGSPTHQVMSVDGATPLMRAAYTAIASRFGDPTAPDRPATITSASVCPVSGKRRGPHCGHSKREMFVAGTVPEAVCDWHAVVCGQRTTVFPEEIAAWARHFNRPSVDPASCNAPDPDAPVRIASPSAGARFVLEPHRPATFQRPPMTAVPASADLVWTVDGQPAAQWVPTVGEHTVRVARGSQSDEVVIRYER